MILYEDAALVVLDKPAGLSSEEGVPAALRKHWGRPDAYVGVIHRLDTGVSGLMVYAKTPQAAAALSRQVAQSQQYYAVQDGRAEPAADAPEDGNSPPVPMRGRLHLSVRNRALQPADLPFFQESVLVFPELSCLYFPVSATRHSGFRHTAG